MRLKYILLLLSITLPFSLHAKEVAGVDIAESISLPGQTSKLVLNGAGIRAKFIFDIYIGSLYLEKKQNTVDNIYKASGNKRISMHFLYDEVSKEKLVNGWNDGFENNNTSEQLQKLKDQISQFNNLFVTAKKGDIINLDFTPGKGTQVIFNGKSMGLVKGDNFFNALLKIWIGEEPADSDLKQAMLGIAEEE